MQVWIMDEKTMDREERLRLEMCIIVVGVSVGMMLGV